MDFGNVTDAVSQLSSFDAILALLAGTVVGLMIGSLPGIGAAAGIGLLLPLTLFLDPVVALFFYVSLYQASEYGGSITAIALRIPGSPNSAVLAYDGFPMARKGYPGLAFAYSLWAVVVAALFTNVVIILVGPLLARAALSLGSSGYVMLGLFGLATVGAISGRSPVRGLLACIAGLLLSTVGLDTLTGEQRYTFGSLNIVDGIPIVPVFVGLFAIPQVMRLFFHPTSAEQAAEDLPKDRYKVWLSPRQFARQWRPMTLGTGLGSVLGLVPGLAGVVDSFISYNVAKMVSRRSSSFGTGVPEGIVAPEATNSAVMHSTLMPAFLLAIPGTPTSALILGAMLIGGLQPGPTFIQNQPEVFYSLFMGLVISTIFLWILGMYGTRTWARLAFMSPVRLGYFILILCMIGAYSQRSSVFDIAVMLAFGFLGYFMEQRDFPVPALIMGFLIGEIVETNLRRSLTLTDGSYLGLLDRPFNVVMLLLAVSVLTLGVVKTARSREPEKVKEPVHS
jgi:putative tricarboxylic transport membrane protein